MLISNAKLFARRVEYNSERIREKRMQVEYPTSRHYLNAEPPTSIRRNEISSPRLNRAIPLIRSRNERHALKPRGWGKWDAALVIFMTLPSPLALNYFTCLPAGLNSNAAAKRKFFPREKMSISRRVQRRVSSICVLISVVSDVRLYIL